MTQADMLLNTSESEGVSNAVLEAMQLGLPVCEPVLKWSEEQFGRMQVVARNIPGNCALLEHQRTGLLFESEVLDSAMIV